MSHVNSLDDEKRLFRWFDATTGREWGSLSEAETAVWKVYHFELAVANGGFDKGILDFGDRWTDLITSLKTIGAEKIAAMCLEAASVFPNGSPAIDTEARFQQWRALDQASKDLLWRLGGEYYDLWKTDPGQDVYSRMFAFLRNEHIL